MQERIFRDGVLVDTIEHPDPSTRPLTLSATAFNKYAASKLAGGGAAGMARFMTIMAAGRADAGSAASFAVAQYDKALTFDKSEVQAFGALLSSAGHMTAEEVTAIVSGWPEN